MIVQDFAHIAEFLLSQGPAGNSRLLNWLWPAKLCLGGALQFHHSAVRSCCVCASPYGLINECVCWQTGLLLRMWFSAFFHLWIFVCEYERLSVCVYVRVCTCMWTRVCVSVSVSWGLWSKRLPQPWVTFSHECVAYDTSSGLGQTSPDPSSNTPGWSPPSPVFPFYTPTATATLPPPFPSPCTGHLVATPPYTLLHVSQPQQQLGSTCSWSAVLLCLAVAWCCSWVTQDQSQLLWIAKVMSQTEMWHKYTSADFQNYASIERLKSKSIAHFKDQ